MNLQTCIEQGKSPFESRLISIYHLAELLQESKASLILYGAGPACNHLLEYLLKMHIIPTCIADRDPEKINTDLMHIRVLSPEAALQKAGDNTICVVSIWTVSTFHQKLVQQLSEIGYKNIYFATIPALPRILDESLIKDIQQYKNEVIQIMNGLADDTSKMRFESYIHAFLSSRLDHCTVMGHYHSLDGYFLNNDLINVSSDDTIIRCRHGFHDDNETYLSIAAKAQQVLLFEPTIVGRIKTKEYLHASTYSHVLVFPHTLANESNAIAFHEKIYFTKFIDQEEYLTSTASSIPLDEFKDDVKPTLIHLDMAEGHLEALRGARIILNLSKTYILLSGFRRISDVIHILNEFKNYNIYIRYFGGITLKDGYVIILKKRNHPNQG
jgi:hypothetical protein